MPEISIWRTQVDSILINRRSEKKSAYFDFLNYVGGNYLMSIGHIEYMCTWCGKRELRSANAGRPSPGNCSRKPKTRNGKPRPHTWIINKRIP